jgi:hypothetical protein
MLLDPETDCNPKAMALEECARELESSLGELELQPLTLGEAAKISGYSTDHLGRLVREGKIPNAGRPGSPRIAPGDVPVKPGMVALDSPESDLNRTQIVRLAINEGAA